MRHKLPPRIPGSPPRISPANNTKPEHSPKFPFLCLPCVFPVSPPLDEHTTSTPLPGTAEIPSRAPRTQLLRGVSAHPQTIRGKHLPRGSRLVSYLGEAKRERKKILSQPSASKHLSTCGMNWPARQGPVGEGGGADIKITASSGARARNLLFPPAPPPCAALRLQPNQLTFSPAAPRAGRRRALYVNDTTPAPAPGVAHRRTA